MTKILETKNNIKKIKEIYAFISQDEKGEGIVGITMDINGREKFMPFICYDEETMEYLKSIAIRILSKNDEEILLIKFDNRKLIEKIEL